MNVNKLVKLVVVLLALSALATAQQSRVYREGGNWTQEIAGNLNAAKNLRVQVDMGSVRVQGGSETGISYVIRSRAYTSSEETARREFASYKVNAAVRGDTAWISAEWQSGRVHKFSGEFIINVPGNMEFVKVATGGGAIDGTGIAGRMEAETGGGSIHLDNIGGSVSAETGGDKVEVGSIGGDVKIQTGGGRVTIGSVRGNVSASTGGGDLLLVSSQQGAVLEAGGGNIQVQQCGGRLRVSTGGGNIDLGNVVGPVEVDTGGGSIRLASAKAMVHAETGAGRIELNGVTSARAETGAGGIVARFVPSSERNESALETAVGDITVYLAPTLSMTIRAAIEAANGHKITSDFSAIQISTEGGEWGTVTARGDLNGGGPVLKLRTTTGNIVIRRSQ